MIKVENNITITLEDGTTISMTKIEAEQLYTALSTALNKIVYPNNNNNLWFHNTPSFGIRDCVAQGAKGAA